MTDYTTGVDTNRFRQKRFTIFRKLIQELASTAKVRVLDIGGTLAYWQGMTSLWQDLPLDITIINLGASPSDDGNLHVRPGNACHLPEFQDNAFDVVHSNSVIEHVGHWTEMQKMAGEVRRLAPHYFVQTPNFWFPMEPHFRTLFFHFYPEQVRARMLMRKRRGFRGPSLDITTAMASIQSACLLDANQMQSLFPDATIEREKIALLTKSLIAVR